MCAWVWMLLSWLHLFMENSQYDSISKLRQYLVNIQVHKNKNDSSSEKSSFHCVLARNGFLTRCSKTKCIVLSHEHPSILYLLCSSPLVNCFTTRYKFVPGKSLKEEKPFFRPKKTVTELQSKDKAIKEQRSSTRGKLFYLLQRLKN